jgi:DNA-binding IclR family transcriptional regulator
LSEAEVLYIEKVETPGMPPTYSFIGKRASVHCTALGKAIMAYTDATEIDYILQRTNFAARTELTIIDQQQYLLHLQAVRQKGYAIDNEEYDWGVRCIAAPVFDFRNHIIGGISVTGPISVMTEDRLLHVADNVKQAAAAISRDLGCALSSR